MGTSYEDSPLLLDPPKHWLPLIGKLFGRLTVVGYAGKKTLHAQKKITCRCACGRYTDVMPAALKSGNTTSCGCAHSEQLAARNAANSSHGDARGDTVAVLYRIWRAIKGRCLDPGNKWYKNYGGRGITVYPPWIESYARFKADILATMGERPSREFSIDRIDNDKGYEPGNVRWAAPKTQNRNKKKRALFTLDGQERGLAEWAELYGADYSLVQQRVHKFGWPLREALTLKAGAKENDNDSLYGVWYMMVKRCHDPNNPRFVDYGGRGICVCERWRESFANFYLDVLEQIGPRPAPEYSLDRTDNTQGYVPGNIRWRTFREQNRNRRNTVMCELEGEVRPLAEWAELASMPYRTVMKRVRIYNWPLDEALGTPIGFGRCATGERQKWHGKRDA